MIIINKLPTNEEGDASNDHQQSQNDSRSDHHNNPQSPSTVSNPRHTMNSFLTNDTPTTCSFQDYLDDSLDNVSFATAVDFGSHAHQSSSSPEDKNSGSHDDGSADENSITGHRNGPFPSSVINHFVSDQGQQDMG